MFKVSNISPHSAPHLHLRAQEASTVLKRPSSGLLRLFGPVPSSLLGPHASHVAHCSAAASLLGPHAVAIWPHCSAAASGTWLCWLLPGPGRPLMAGAFRELCRRWGRPGLASPHRYPHSHSLGDPPTSEAALAQLQAEVPADLPLRPLF